jgi:hypothetical protein
MRSRLPRATKNSGSNIKTKRGKTKMVNAKKAAIGKYLKPVHVVESINKIAVIIDGGQYKKNQYGEQLEIGVQYNKISQTLCLNQKSANALLEEYGEETDNWVGKKIELKVIESNGKEVLFCKPFDGITKEKEEVEVEQVK